MTDKFPDDPKPEKCALCSVPCCGMRINQAFLCDSHFDAWLAYPRDERGCGQRMADFMREEKEILEQAKKEAA